MRKALAILLLGLVTGSGATIVLTDVVLNRYTYYTFDDDACRHLEYVTSTATLEVVPNQPNPCHFRRRRW